MKIELKVKNNIAHVKIEGKIYSTACSDFIEIDTAEVIEWCDPMGGCSGICECCEKALPQSLKQQAN